MKNRQGFFLSFLLFLLGLAQLACGSGGGGNNNGPTAPTAVSYSTNPAVYLKDVAIAANTPTVSGGAATSFTVNPALPAGLALNASTGAITGTPTVASAAASYFVTATNAAGSAQVALSIAVTEGPVAPTITTQPQANQTVAAGASVSFTVVATGTAPLSYQWRKGGTAIGGATSATYTIASAVVGDSGTYTVAVSNGMTPNAVSSNAVLTVNAAPPAPTLTAFAPETGLVDTLVTLTGTNLAEVTAVRFNGTVATLFTVVNDTQVTARVPTGATSGPITVITPLGTAISAASFAVEGPIRDCPVVTPPETFTASDSPVTSKLQTFDLTTPWGYSKPENSARKYPLVVNGCWGEGYLFSEAVRKKFPAFYLDFNNYSTESHGELLATLINAASQASYRIDASRIYLTGFSQGGSGSFKLVRGMLTKGKLFAGIVRVAGQSESVLAEGAVEKTSLWYHIGLKDDPLRIEVARATYAALKVHASNATAVESTSTDTITGFSRTTKTMTKNGIEIVKMSEYPELGHDPAPCYKDPALFEWLFNQSLPCR